MGALLGLAIYNGEGLEGGRGPLGREVSKSGLGRICLHICCICWH